MVEKLTRPRTVVEDLINRAIANGKVLRSDILNSNPASGFDRLKIWDNQVKKLLAGVFTGPEPSENYPTILSEPYWADEDGVIHERMYDGLSSRIVALQSISDMLPLYEEPSDAILVGQDHPAPRSSTSVFVVHGHTEGPKQQVARFLETATDAQPVILHEQAKRGQVIIETLESYAAMAAFAIVLLTADDKGGLAGSRKYLSRARQNVVFELGFFIGALGRSRVAVLYEEDVDLPSDMNGILYTILDSQGAWKLGLGRELRAAGFAVDLNLAR